jgi:hypothetical protein
VGTTQTPPTEHIVFDELCAEIEDFQPLPTVTSASPEFASEHRDELDEDPAPLDGLILAGLVSP